MWRSCCAITVATNNLHGMSVDIEHYAIRLLPELYAHLNPMPCEVAAHIEKDLADELRWAGYTVSRRH